MFKKLILGGLLLTLGVSNTDAQTTLWAEFVNPPGIENPYVISGIIKDPNTNDPIPFAGILFREGNKTLCNTTTDYQGRFYLEIDPDWVSKNQMEVVYYFKMYKEKSKFYSKKSHYNQIITLEHQTSTSKNFLR